MSFKPDNIKMSHDRYLAMSAIGIMTAHIMARRHMHEYDIMDNAISRQMVGMDTYVTRLESEGIETEEIETTYDNLAHQQSDFLTARVDNYLNKQRVRLIEKQRLSLIKVITECPDLKKDASESSRGAALAILSDLLELEEFPLPPPERV